MGIDWQQAKSAQLKKYVQMNRVGLVTDMDGTISHITEEPADAVVTERNCALLNQLNQKLTLLAIISGRSLRGLAGRMAIPDVVYIGNHGLERCTNDGVEYGFDVDKYQPHLKESVDALEKIQFEGTLVEDKEITVTLHYRQTADPARARQQLLPRVQAIAAQNKLDFFEGRMIFELRPPVKADKGSAFQKVVAEYALDSVLYIGDDTTDIAALTMARQLRQEQSCYALGVGVISDNAPPELQTEADLLVSGVTDVENLFAWILENI